MWLLFSSYGTLFEPLMNSVFCLNNETQLFLTLFSLFPHKQNLEVCFSSSSPFFSLLFQIVHIRIYKINLILIIVAKFNFLPLAIINLLQA